jgi:hypothetical protein
MTAAWRDQEIAHLFNECEWSQENKPAVAEESLDPAPPAR